MPDWVWILIAVAVLVLLAVLFFAARRARERRMETQRAEEQARAERQRAEERERAEQLRGEAQQRLSDAGQQEAVAQQAAERARRERAAAEEAIRRAEDVDPDVPNIEGTRAETGADGAPTSGGTETGAELRDSDVTARADESATVRRDTDDLVEEPREERPGSTRAPRD